MNSIQVAVEGTRIMLGAKKGEDGMLVVSYQHYPIKKWIGGSRYDIVIFEHPSERMNERFCRVHVSHLSDRAVLYDKLLQTAPFLHHEPDGDFLARDTTGEQTRTLISHWLRQ
jgi:hypothetical protein